LEADTDVGTSSRPLGRSSPSPAARRPCDGMSAPSVRSAGRAAAA
jgi:hypothetical protein